MPRFALFLAIALSGSSLAQAADVALQPSPTPGAVPLYNPADYEIRGGFFESPFGPEKGTTDFNGSLVFPKFFALSGWDDLFVPRFRIGGDANLGGRTSYAYADALWTLNFGRFFAESFFGGLVHDGQLVAVPKNETALGCRELYHMGVDLGYRFDAHWSVMGTFEHGSNGEPVMSDCPQNRGINVTGVSVGYSF